MSERSNNEDVWSRLAGYAGGCVSAFMLGMTVGDGQPIENLILPALLVLVIFLLAEWRIRKADKRLDGLE